MKELIIEEKAKAYDTSLEAARCIYNNMKECGNFGGMEDLEVIFPELKESEDEGIRKVLINGFNKLDKSAVWYNGVTNGQILDWLEKQGEQKLTDKEMKELLRTDYEKGRADAIAEMQKPWSEEDETMITDLSVIVYTYFSEISGIPFKYDLSEDKIRTWLKSLKYRVQPKQEWSEEDIDNIKNIIILCTHSIEGIECTWIPSQAAKIKELMESILHSLKPHSQWKPSDTEINILQGVIDGSFKPENVKVTLVNILEQLKKLRADKLS